MNLKFVYLKDFFFLLAKVSLKTTFQILLFLENKKNIYFFKNILQTTLRKHDQKFLIFSKNFNFKTDDIKL